MDIIMMSLEIYKQGLNLKIYIFPLNFNFFSKREIILSPLIVTGLLGKVDIEAKVIFGVGGKSVTPRAIRTATGLALAALYPDLAERLRLAGMLNYDKRRKERKKVFQ
jgi:ribosomal protein S9